MPEHLSWNDDDLVNVETHHEKSDVPIRPLFVFIVIFVIFGIVTHLVLWGVYKGMAAAERKASGPKMTDVQRPENMNVPQNQPLLQPFPQKTREGVEVPPVASTPVVDLAEMRKTEQEALSNYGWVDQQKSVVRLPIDVAKQLLVQRGLPGPTAAAPAAAAPAAPAATTTAAPATTTTTTTATTTGGQP